MKTPMKLWLKAAGETLLFLGAVVLSICAFFGLLALIAVYPIIIPFLMIFAAFVIMTIYRHKELKQAAAETTRRASGGVR